MRTTLLLVTVVAFIGCFAYASAETVYAELNFNDGVAQAQSRGDVSYLLKAANSAAHANTRAAAHVAYLLSQMRLSDAASEGMRCFAKAKKKNKVGLAIRCATLAASAALTNQNLAAFSRIVIRAEDYVYPILAKMAGREAKIKYFDSFSAKNFVDIPPVTVDRDKGGEFLPWAETCPTEGEIPEAHVKINNHVVCAFVDTGSPTGMPRDIARKLGLVMREGKYPDASAAIPGTTVEGTLATAASVQIAGVKLHHVPFQVTDGGKYIVIGSDTLQQLGDMLFTRQGLKLLDSENRGCARPMAYAFGYFPLVPTLPAIVDRKRIRIGFDSGQRWPLLTNAQKIIAGKDINFAAPETHHRAFGISSGMYGAEATFATSSSASKPIPVVLKYVPKDTYPISVRAGFAILQQYDVLLGFRSHVACFLSHNK